MNVLLLGAGASKSYSDSLTKVKMPIAKDFFRTFNQLEISGNRWVLTGDLLNYLRDYHNTPYTDFISYEEDIEVLHSEIENRLRSLLKNKEDIFRSPENTLIYKTYIQLIFVFVSVINEIQNGPPSSTHLNLAQYLSSNDIIITFNWDTLMDRALNETSSWTTDGGYAVKPSMIYRDKWIRSVDCNVRNYPLILKLHGSTNWLTSCLRPDGDKLKPTQETPIDDFYVYESTIEPYSTYQGRFMSGYSDYSYGYYPPNLPLKGEQAREGHVFTSVTATTEDMPKGTAPSKGLISMPLIIPPVKHKDYAYFGSVFSQLWKKAEESIAKADRIIVIGYSFPETDTQTDTMFLKAFSRRTDMPEVIIVNPTPEPVEDRFILKYGIKSDYITTHKMYFDEHFEIESLFGS